MDSIGPRFWLACRTRKERCTPLDKPTVTVLRDWLTERAGQPTDPLFPTRRGQQMTRDAVQARLTKYQPIAAQTCPSLAGKNLAPHVLRHYVDGWVMWRVGVFPLAGGPRGPVSAPKAAPGYRHGRGDHSR